MGDKKKKKVRKKEICQIPSIKSIFSVFGLLFKKMNASANRQVQTGKYILAKIAIISSTFIRMQRERV